MATTITEIRAKVSAETVQTHQGRIHNIRFPFSKDPDTKVWRRVGSGWMPRRNTRAGRAIAALIDSYNAQVQGN